MRLRSGKVVAFLGPDGAGKSTILGIVQATLTDTRVPFSNHYFAPGFLKRYRPKGDGAITTNPHEGRQYGSLLVAAKILLMLFEFRMGVARLRKAPKLALFDRYILDILVDPKRYRMGQTRWWIRALLKFAPRPDLLIVISAPAHVIQSRKQEVPAAETARQVAAYEALAASMKQGVIVSNATTPETAAAEILVRLRAIK